MRIAIMSDLHLDHYNDGARRFANHLDSLRADGDLEEADVCVVAGDIADGRFPDMYEVLFRALRNYYPNVIVVTGNHDYYRAGEALAHHSIRRAIRNLDAEAGGSVIAGAASHIDFLHNTSVSIDGRLFHGGTMWYAHRDDHEAYEHWMNDVHQIPDFKPWVYQQNLFFDNFAHGKVSVGDIVVTHHLPSPKSTPRRFLSSPLNRFFVHDMEQLIESRRPALWIHGHTHDACDYMLFETRVVCHPRGYPRENSHGARGYLPRVVEI